MNEKKRDRTVLQKIDSTAVSLIPPSNPRTTFSTQPVSTVNLSSSPTLPRVGWSTLRSRSCPRCTRLSSKKKSRLSRHGVITSASTLATPGSGRWRLLTSFRRSIRRSPSLTSCVWGTPSSRWMLPRNWRSKFFFFFLYPLITSLTTSIGSFLATTSRPSNLRRVRRPPSSLSSRNWSPTSSRTFSFASRAR